MLECFTRRITSWINSAHMCTPLGRMTSKHGCEHLEYWYTWRASGLLVIKATIHHHPLNGSGRVLFHRLGGDDGRLVQIDVEGARLWTEGLKNNARRRKCMYCSGARRRKISNRWTYQPPIPLFVREGAEWGDWVKIKTDQKQVSRPTN